MVDLRLLLEANEFLRAENRRRQELVAAREAKARALLADCEAEKRELEAELSTLDAADMLYRRRIVPHLPTDRDEDQPALAVSPPFEIPAKQQARARIGRQRYLILAHLRSSRYHVSSDEIAEATYLPMKRVRDQLRSDVTDGFVGEADGRYFIRSSGLALMDKFELYKRAKGEPLPSFEDPSEDDDPEDSEDNADPPIPEEESDIMP